MYCNKFNCKNQKLPLRSLHFGPWSRLWHSHSQSQSGNLSGKCIGNIYKCISRLHALVSACVCIYIYICIHANMSIEMTTESADQMMMKNISACDPFSNRTVPTQTDRLLRWVALMQLIKDPKRETKNTHSLKGFHVPCTKPRICG